MNARMTLKGALLIGLGAWMGMGMGMAVVAQADGAPSAETVQHAITAAEAARKEAAAVGGEWRDTAELIQQAATAAKAGDLPQALALAEEARREGEAGRAQMMAQQELPLPSYLKK